MAGRRTTAAAARSLHLQMSRHVAAKQGMKRAAGGGSAGFGHHASRDDALLCWPRRAPGDRRRITTRYTDVGVAGYMLSGRQLDDLAEIHPGDPA